MILPNNKNIIPVAEQVDGLRPPRRSPWCPPGASPRRFAALLAYDPEADRRRQRRRRWPRPPDQRGRRRGHPGRARLQHATSAPIAAGDWLGLSPRRASRSIGRRPGVGARSPCSTACVTDAHEIVTDDRGRGRQRAVHPAASPSGCATSGGASRPRSTTAASRSTRTSSASSERDSGQAAPRSWTELPVTRLKRRRARAGRSALAQAWTSRRCFDLLTHYPPPLPRQDEAVADPRRRGGRADVDVRCGSCRPRRSRAGAGQGPHRAAASATAPAT